MYEFQIKPSEKVFLVTLSGFITKEEGQKLTTDLMAKIKTFNPSDYYVVIDAQELKASNQDSLDDMKKGIELFANGAFKGAYNIVSKNVITNVQANRVGKEVGFSKIIQVHSYEEARKLIK